MNIKKLIKKTIGYFYYNFYLKYQKNYGNRIILYHSIGTKLEHDNYGISISKKKFIEHIRYLKKNYEFISKLV